MGQSQGSDQEVAVVNSYTHSIILSLISILSNISYNYYCSGVTDYKMDLVLI